jgi:hypothetical protein
VVRLRTANVIAPGAGPDGWADGTVGAVMGDDSSDQGPPAVPPFPFVVGCNRSGTTLLRAMLDAHPDLAVPPEAYFTLRALRPGSPDAPFAPAARLAEIEANRSFATWALPPGALAGVTAAPPADPAELVRAVYRVYAEHHGKPRAGDKTPRNVLHVPTIAAALPEARFVHLVRDGRDVVPSVREHLLGPESLPATIDYWRDRVLAGRRAGATLGPDRYLEVRYEDLVADPEAVLPTVCRFLGLDYTPSMLDYPGRAERLIAGTWDARRHAGVGRPPTAGVRDWRTAMAPADLRLFDELAGDLLDELGYGRSGLSPSAGARARARAWRASAPLRRAVRPVTSDLARRRRRRRRRRDPGAPPVPGANSSD